jgi:hypothetical protein
MPLFSFRPNIRLNSQLVNNKQAEETLERWTIELRLPGVEISTYSGTKNLENQIRISSFIMYNNKNVSFVKPDNGGGENASTSNENKLQQGKEVDGGGEEEANRNSRKKSGSTPANVGENLASGGGGAAPIGGGANRPSNDFMASSTAPIEG